MSDLDANRVDPDQTPHSAVSDLGLYCLQMSIKGTQGLNGLNSREIRDKRYFSIKVYIVV